MLIGLNLSSVYYTQADLKRSNLFDCGGWYGPPWNYWLAASEGYRRPGAYTLTADGIGKIVITDRDVPTTNQMNVFNFTSNRERYTLNLTTTTGSRLRASVAQSDKASPIKNIQLYQQGLTPGTFHPAYIADLAGFDTLRTVHFYDVDNPNKTATDEVTWAQADQTRWQWIIDLCNATNCNPWICIPDQASADYCTKCGQLMHGLFPWLEPRIEFGNEIWNTAYPFGNATGRIQARAKLENLSLDQGYTKYAAQAFDAFNAGFGRAFLRVLSGQFYNVQTIKNRLTYASANGVKFDALAGAPYSAPSATDWPTIEAAWDNDEHDIAIKAFMDSLYTGLARTETASQQWRKVADQANMLLFAYEWAPQVELTGSGYVADQISVAYAASADPQMGKFVVDLGSMLGKYFVAGNYFDHCSPPWNGTEWGSKSYLDDPMAAKYAGLKTLRQRYNP